MIKVLLFLFFLPFVVCSCSSDEEDDKRIVEEHSYYVKYEITASGYTNFGHSISFALTYTFTTDTGNKTVTTGQAKDHNWEATYGPFKKGKKILLDVSKANRNHARIYVSRDKEPFVIKAESDVEYSPISLQYTIDY